LGIGIEDVGIQRLVIVVPGKGDFVHVVVECFLLRAKENDGWLCPVRDPIGNHITGSFRNRGW
jgi:hypothetical protein